MVRIAKGKKPKSKAVKGDRPMLDHEKVRIGIDAVCKACDKFNLTLAERWYVFYVLEVSARKMLGMKTAEFVDGGAIGKSKLQDRIMKLNRGGSLVDPALEVPPSPLVIVPGPDDGAGDDADEAGEEKEGEQD